MPKLKQTTEAKANDACRELIDIMISRLRIPRTEANVKLGISYPTFRRRYSNPAEMTIGELRKLAKSSTATDEQILRIVRG